MSMMSILRSEISVICIGTCENSKIASYSEYFKVIEHKKTTHQPEQLFRQTLRSYEHNASA